MTAMAASFNYAAIFVAVNFRLSSGDKHKQQYRARFVTARSRGVD